MIRNPMRRMGFFSYKWNNKTVRNKRNQNNRKNRDSLLISDFKTYHPFTLLNPIFQNLIP
ncbi:hypothetical protein DYBT9275_03208 [Dyadobacter sp. CECT 9275]|uniref:Uncharacterized protein n=1 Tax=Dyadobacter helix TaxID=2822344 RepID=A0A916JD12_9BACT|nr:hypothetical protein DYBT9275_03208 [Dyadobacter sp. CECT 9275]